MKRATRRICYLAIGIGLLSLLISPIPVWSEEPTLARLSFWVPPEQVNEFAAIYAEKILPLLQQRGFKPSTRTVQPTAAGLFSQLFETESPPAFYAANKALIEDPTWIELMQHLGAEFGADEGKPLHPYFRVYQTPAGPGKIVPAGSGFRQGLWLGFSARDGLSSSDIWSILKDRDGDLWFGGAGVSRFDGQVFEVFTTADGLPTQGILSMLEDRDGNLWFASGQPFSRHGAGVCRFDGQTFRIFTTEDGLTDDMVWDILEDRNGDLWFATDGGVSRYDGEKFTPFPMDGALEAGPVMAIMEDRKGDLWFSIEEKGVSRYDRRKDVGQRFDNFTTEDGLASKDVYDMLEDRDGNLWFATGNGGGVSRYDRRKDVGQRFDNFTTEDGLVDDSVKSIMEDRSGNLWFGTFGDGVSRYDGQNFESFTTEDGLLGNSVRALLEDREGQVWVGTFGGGVNRYSGAQFTHLTPADGLVDEHVMYVLEDREGILWFGTWGGVSRYDGRRDIGQRFETILELKNNVWYIEQDQEGNLWFGGDGGVFRYDGNEIEAFTTADGLPNDLVISIVAARDGHIWFGTWGGGISRYDGETFTTFTTEDGLANNYVYGMMEDRQGRLWPGTVPYDDRGFTAVEGLKKTNATSILEDREGNLWFTTADNGVIRYDGKRATALTAADGLASNNVWSIIQDRNGDIWFGHYGDGVTRYDGLVFQHLSRKDGLVSDAVQEVRQGRDGLIWIATEGGITRYRPSRTPPQVRLTGMIADRRYGPEPQLSMSSAQEFILFEFQGSSLTTAPDQMAYVFRFAGLEEEWRTTRETQVEYRDLPMGSYTFEVKAVDRDLNYSEQPATVRVDVHAPYRQIALLGGLGVALIGFVLVSLYAVGKRRDQRRAERALIEELEEELQTAHEMQMSLMPAGSPHLESFDIVGRCLPANHVGGDFFQYHPLLDGKLALSLADVTGHAMEAAVPVIMFSGILHSQMELGDPPDRLFGRLNRTLYETLDNRTFVCFTMGELEPSTGIFRFANAGCPYPYHYRASTGEVEELQADAYPLGISADAIYSMREMSLAPGDRIVFCSDGIAEATNEREEMFGFEQTAATIRQGCTDGLSAEALIDRLIDKAKSFAGATPQGDDMTAVVLRVKGKTP